MTVNHPQEAAGARLADERTESEVRYAETANGPQAGTERFMPGWAPHMDAYAKNFPTPVPPPADVRDQIVRAVSRVLLDSAGRLVPNHIAETAQAVSDTADAVLRVPAIAEALKAAAGISDIARGYCPHCGRGDAAPTTDQWLHERRRAEQAEATGGEARTALAIQKAISADLRVESRARGEKLERVRQLHRSERSDMGWDECGECRTPYPCPTIAALDPQEQP